MKEERKEKNMWKEKCMNLFDRLGGRKLDIILVYQKLVFVTQTGRYTSREQILEDLAKSTTQYGNMMRNECKIFADKYQVIQLKEYNIRIVDLERSDAANDEWCHTYISQNSDTKADTKGETRLCRQAAQDKPPVKLGFTFKT